MSSSAESATSLALHVRELATKAKEYQLMRANDVHFRRDLALQRILNDLIYAADQTDLPRNAGSTIQP